MKYYSSFNFMEIIMEIIMEKFMYLSILNYIYLEIKMFKFKHSNCSSLHFPYTYIYFNLPTFDFSSPSGQQDPEPPDYWE